MILHDNLVSGEGDQRSPRHGVVARRIGTIALLASSPRPAAGHLDAAAVWLEFRSRTNVRHRSTRLAVSSVHQLLLPVRLAAAAVRPVLQPGPAVWFASPPVRHAAAVHTECLAAVRVRGSVDWCRPR